MSSILYSTERLDVRQLDACDLDTLHAVYSDADAMRWVGDGQPLDREGCKGWIEITRNNYAHRGYGMSAVVERASGLVVGFCGLVHPGGQDEAELKYAFLRAHWGRGFATEAARGMLGYGFGCLGLEAIIATVAAAHRVSQGVLMKAGMRYRETLEEDDGSRTLVFTALPPGSC